MITKKDALKINNNYYDFKLKSNFHVGIIESGPAGSFLGYYILDLAGRMALICIGSTEYGQRRHIKGFGLGM